MKIKKKLLDIIKDKIRFKHYCYLTEKTYVHWTKCYMFFHNKKYPIDIGKREIEKYLSSLVVKNRVSPSTQNQAFSTIHFLYKEVLGIDIRFGKVYICDSKSPKTKFETKWQYLFPKAKVSKDSRSQTIRQYHIHPKTIGVNIKIASQKTNLNKRMTSHIFRHGYSTYLLQAGIDLRSIQKLLGHKSVETTMIYTHVASEMNKAKVVSPLDF